MLSYEIPIIASSDPNNGAENVSSDGSSFDIRLEDPLFFPDNLETCYVTTEDSTVWWTVPNISALLGNNMFYIEYNAVNYMITLPDGLYALSDLNNALDREITSATGVAGLINLEADNATQKVSITLNVATIQIDFTQNDTFRDILGFNSQLIPDPNPSVGSYTMLGNNVASFNSIEYFVLHSDIVPQGIRQNNSFTQVIAKIPINVSPGSQIVFTPFNPPKVPAHNLRGSTIDRIRFWLTDQNNNLVNTNTETYSCRLNIKYTLK